jgi:heat shock protein HslJ
MAIRNPLPALLSALLIQICAAAPAQAADAQDRSPDNAAAPQVQPRSDAPLENTYWRLVEIAGQPAQVHPGEREAYLLLLDGRASGSSGCNKLMGSYTHAAPGALRVGPLAGTRMACPPAMMVQEQALATAYERGTRYRIAGETLTLLDGDTPLARFEARHFK